MGNEETAGAQQAEASQVKSTLAWVSGFGKEKA